MSKSYKLPGGGPPGIPAGPSRAPVPPQPPAPPTIPRIPPATRRSHNQSPVKKNLVKPSLIDKTIGDEA